MGVARNPWPSLAALAAASLAAPAQAQAPYELRYEPVSTVALGGTLVVGTALTLVFLEPPASCRWCEPGSPDDDLAPALFASENRETLKLVSDVGQYTAWIGGLAVSFAGGFYGAGRGRRGAEHGGQNAWAVTEAVLATYLLTRVVKQVTARRRPGASLGFTSDDVDEYTSFFSGHSSQTASVAASVATVAFLRGYAWAPAAAVGFGTVAVTTALFRVVSGRHWATDALVGLLVGTAVGIAMPVALHSRRDSDSN